MKIETPLEYMENLNWDQNTLKKCKTHLEEWDRRPKSFYKNNLTRKVDFAEREHFRNCVEFWEERLKEGSK